MSFPTRIHGLDQLRGLLAFSVMLYHFSTWSNYSLPHLLAAPLSKLGLYSVSSFYILSGCALGIAYKNEKISIRFLSEFWIKRFFRIVPMFWLITTASLLLQAIRGISNPNATTERIILSYTMLFSWFEPSAYFSTGGWSIGNEWAFYTLFPLLLFAGKRPTIKIGSIILSCCLFILFSFFILNPTQGVELQWKTWINPLNQWHLFFCGFLLTPHIIAPPKLTQLTNSILLASFGMIFILMSFFVTSSESIHGLSRVLLTGCCIFFCYFFGRIDLTSKKTGNILNHLGAISYSVYLIHPIIFTITMYLFRRVSIIDSVYRGNIGMLFAIPTTLVMSHLTYIYIEKPFIHAAIAMIRKRKGASIANA